MAGGNAAEDGYYSFDVGDVTVGGRTHKGLSVSFRALKGYSDSPTGLPRPRSSTSAARSR